MTGDSLYDLLELSGLEIDHTKISRDIFIDRISADSRTVNRSDIFVVIPSAQSVEYTKQALDKGASAILATPEIIALFSSTQDHQAVFIEYPNPRLALSLLAKAYFNNQPKHLMAVTGTNGKSSVVSMVRQIFDHLGYSVASFGTIGLELGNSTQDSGFKNFKTPALTTYDSLSFFQLLSDLSENDINHVAFEASSHGLDQYRIHGSELQVAGFTNLTQDHLDYHQTMDEYFKAKAKLFSEVLPTGKTVVINKNSPYFEELSNIAASRDQRFISYAVDDCADLCATDLKIRENSFIFNLTYSGLTYSGITLNLAGIFQVENMLCAIGMSIAQGISISEIITVIPKIKSVSGRMEYVGETPTGGHIYVDYAHTPDALERALKSLKSHTSGELSVLFGCGGDRDTSKRPLMGKIASDLADKVIVTDDNPRIEDPAYIRQQIIAACDGKIIEIPNRSEAIKFGIADLKKADTLLIAGKGHETVQIIGNTPLPFSDIQEAKKALESLK